MSAAIRPRRLVVAGGTWETRWGLLGAVVNAVSDQWPAIWLDYPASYATPEAYQDSEDRGITDLIIALRQLPATVDIAVLGFSQGAAIVDKGLREMADIGGISNLSILHRITYVGLCGNPYRAPHDQIGPDPGGSGVIGPLAPASSRPIRGQWHNYALPGDLITACPPDSLARLVYPLTRWMSIQTPDRWARDLQSKLNLWWLLRNFPELRDIRQLPRLTQRVAATVDDVAAYQITGIHGQYASRPLSPTLPTAAGHIINSLQELAWTTH